MPYLVNATAGTTVFGVYDPLDKIADICQKYRLWMHVDGAWGGSALLSKTYRGLLKGIDRYLQILQHHTCTDIFTNTIQILLYVLERSFRISSAMVNLKLGMKYDGLFFRADSMTWNPHKMMGAPLQSAAFLTRHKVR